MKPNYPALALLTVCGTTLLTQAVALNNGNFCLQHPKAQQCWRPLPKSQEVDHTPRITLPTWTDVATATAVSSMDIGLDWIRV